MVRSFTDAEIDLELINSLVKLSLRSPTAGNTRGVSWLILSGKQQTDTYWELTTTKEWRSRSKRWPNLAKAPVVALSLVSPSAYVERYREQDKLNSGLGISEDAWPIPYWFGDAGFATFALLLAARNAELGACFLGNFRGEENLLGCLGVPTGVRLFGTVLIGHLGEQDWPSRSLERPTPTEDERISYGYWGLDSCRGPLP